MQVIEGLDADEWQRDTLVQVKQIKAGRTGAPTPMRL
jgi:hypothetical protein